MEEMTKTMKIQPKSIYLVAGSLQKCDLNGVVVNTRERLEWTCVPLTVLNCCDTLESKDKSEI